MRFCTVHALKATLAGGGIVTLMLVYYGLLTVTSLSNAFAIGGIVLLCSGLLSFVLSTGFLDLPVFGVRKAWEVATTRRYGSEPSKIGTFREYIQKEKRPGPTAELVVVGALFLVISALLLAA